MARIRVLYQKAILLARLQRQSLDSPLLMSASKCILKQEFSRMPARESSFRMVKWNPLQAVESHCCALIINPIVTIYPPIVITGGGRCYSLGFSRIFPGFFQDFSWDFPGNPQGNPQDCPICLSAIGVKILPYLFFVVRVRILSDMFYRAARHSITCFSRL